VGGVEGSTEPVGALRKAAFSRLLSACMYYPAIGEFLVVLKRLIFKTDSWRLRADSFVKRGFAAKGIDTMPNPKRRHSQKRTSTRRAHDALKGHSLSECPNCHERKMPHRACPKCGYYKGREVLDVEEAS